MVSGARDWDHTVRPGRSVLGPRQLRYYSSSHATGPAGGTGTTGIGCPAGARLNLASVTFRTTRSGFNRWKIDIDSALFDQGLFDGFEHVIYPESGMLTAKAGETITITVYNDDVASQDFYVSFAGTLEII